MAATFTMERPGKRAGVDTILLGSTLLLAGAGLANLYSASYGYALSLGRAPGYFALRQLAWYLPATAVFAVCAMAPLDRVRTASGAFVLAGLVLLLLPFAPVIGITRNGASRWFGFGGLSFQPSELFKPVLVFYLAHILSKKADRLADVVNAVIPPLLLAAAGTGIVLLQNDFSTALMVAALAVVMFWVADAPLVFFAALASIALPLAALSVLTNDYRLERVIGFLAPRFDPGDLSYQVNGSIRAIEAGGLFGKGIGQGSLKLASIPEVYSDFVFSAWAEETGLAGVLAVLSLWGVLLWRAYRSSLRADDGFRSLLGFGMATYLGFQVLVNVMVEAGAAPATGIPLPLFSSGGSSLLSVAAALGCVVNVARSPEAREGAPDHV